VFLLPDGTLWVQLINFAIFFVILRMVFLRSVGKAIAERRAYIESLNTDYEIYQGEANSLRTQAEAIRAAARRDAEAYMAHARAEASNQAAALAEEYGQRAQSEIAAAQATVNAELEQARAGELDRAGELAELMLKQTLVEAAS
jgi:F0F1-type ATP synthase membrane subunit b/b'